MGHWAFSTPLGRHLDGCAAVPVMRALEVAWAGVPALEQRENESFVGEGADSMVFKFQVNTIKLN